MIFKSKIKRQWIRKAVIAILADLLMAACITALVTTYELWYGQWALVFIVIFLGLQVFDIARRTIFGILRWVAFRLYDRNLLKEMFLSMFRGAKLPCPNEFEDSPEQYTSNVVDNSECAIDVRLGAANIFGYITGMQQTIGWYDNLRLATALEDAVAAYRESFPSSASA